MIDSPTIVDCAAQLAAVIHIQVKRDAIHSVMEPAISELLSVIKSQGIGPIGPLFSYHLTLDPEAFNFEVGFPVSQLVTPEKRVRPGQLPAARVAQTIYRGPYEALHSAWMQFRDWMQDKNLKPAPNLWERYLTGPEINPDPDSWQTELNRPILD